MPNWFTDAPKKTFSRLEWSAGDLLGEGDVERERADRSGRESAPRRCPHYLSLLTAAYRYVSLLVVTSSVGSAKSSSKSEAVSSDSSPISES